MPEQNPFLAPDNPFTSAKEVQVASSLPPCGDPSCKRPHRPGSGDHYSSDPSERTKALIADGKMGKQFGVLGGAKAKRKRRAAEVVAEAAAEDADKIRDVFRDGIDPSNPIGVRLQAAKEYLKVENDEEDRTLAERQAEFDAMSKDQLVGSVQEMLSRLKMAGAIAGEVEEMTNEDEGIVDADVVE